MKETESNFNLKRYQWVHTTYGAPVMLKELIKQTTVSKHNTTTVPITLKKPKQSSPKDPKKKKQQQAKSPSETTTTKTDYSTVISKRLQEKKDKIKETT